MSEQNNNQDLQQDENKLIALRREKLADIRSKGNAFPNNYSRDSLAGNLQNQFAGKTKEELSQLNQYASIAGRVMAKRGPFLLLQDMSGRIQAYIDRKGLDKELLKEIDTWDIGDIIGVSGPISKSGKGDLYVKMEAVVMLTKSLRPLPEKFHGLTDQEQRYRMRYVDLIMNQEAREKFKIRSKIVAFIRSYLNDKDFLEVETPMMQSIPGGAAAKPFVTHHNALDMQLYLRIAPELYLKRLVVGGFEKVFEINRNFRNEGLSTRHNPEFTMLEFYEAYAEYHTLMDRTEDMLRQLASHLYGKYTIEYQGSTYDFEQPFTRMSVKESVLMMNPNLTESDLLSVEALRNVCVELSIPYEKTYGTGKLLIEVFEKTVEDRLDQPTFITEYPTEVSPLARRNDVNPEVTDRFEFFVGGKEIANGFSELNDAEDQAARFKEQAAQKDGGDEEAMHYDADYIRALEYGLPPTAGEGIGIDRLVMLFTDSASIRDVLLFPQMR
ncbi:MAG: lysine--tRNA ligase [Gammaproteobacteria bacterium]|nr:lysine--tRNA ligase [Gammaproteobacteria bacterium]